ncbi:MAG: glycosyltransferase, exosortase A system-associated [Burkholderiaceae bacterium]
MRVLHVLDHSLPLQSGYAFRTVSILNAQRRLGWETAHLTTPRHNRSTQTAEEAGGFVFERSPKPRSFLADLPLLGLAAEMRSTRSRLRELAGRFKPDILHAHSPVLDGLPALSIGRELGIPVVYEIRAFWEDAASDLRGVGERTLRYRLTRKLETSVCRRADAVTTICNGLRQDLEARGIDARRITVIPNAVDVERFELIERVDEDLKASLGIAGASVIGFCGSFYAYEGLDLAIRAMPAIKRQVGNAKLLLVGGGPEEGALKALAASLGLQQDVVFSGRVPHDQVARYYSVIDVLAYPRHSMRLTELVTPLKPLEAMAQGRPFVASDVGGHRELIEHERTGLLAKAGDADALASQLLRLLGDAELKRTLVSNGRRHVETERTWDRSIDGYRKAYAMAIENRGRRRG